MSKSERAKKSDSAVATAVRVGVDLGTNTSVIAASADGKPMKIKDDVVKTVVGFPKAGIIPGILPGDDVALFGEEALEYRLHLDLNWPLNAGVVRDPEVASLFARHLGDRVGGGDSAMWGVIGAPANASEEQQKNLRSAMVGVLERLLVVPEPFLAAMGLREDPVFTAQGVGDPTKHSLIIDIGGGTSDICLVRGYYPSAEDQISFPEAGNHIDTVFAAALMRRFPDLKLTAVTITQLKENHSFVSGFERDANVKVYVDGRPRVIDFADIVREACDALVPTIVKGIKELLSRCDSDSIVSVMENIIVTGGGSQIQGLTEKIQEVLLADGYDCARTVRPTDYKRLVARGALKIADSVRDDQWQVPM